MEETSEVTEGKDREKEKDWWLFSKDGFEGEHKCVLSIFRCAVYAACISFVSLCSLGKVNAA